jgi:protein-tyrosine phosphatase
MNLFGGSWCTIDWLEHRAFAGRIGMTRCPGTWSGPERLADDIAAIRGEGTTALVSLNELEELDMAGLSNLGNAARRRRLAWYHLPIRDFDVPDEAFERKWAGVGPELRRRLLDGESIVLHCWAGLGRTGTIAARLLVEFGEDPLNAIHLVRIARPGAVQTVEQEAPMCWTSGNGW